VLFHIFPEAFFINIGKPTFCPATILRPGKIFRQNFSGILRFAFLPVIGDNSETDIKNIAIVTARHAIKIGLRNEWGQFLCCLLNSEHLKREQKPIVSEMLSAINGLNLMIDQREENRRDLRMALPLDPAEAR
jgi:hypothetical protein